MEAGSSWPLIQLASGDSGRRPADRRGQPGTGMMLTTTRGHADRAPTQTSGLSVTSPEPGGLVTDDSPSEIQEQAVR